MLSFRALGFFSAIVCGTAIESLRLSNQWRYLGPFPIGKTELDADVVSQATALGSLGSKRAFPSELAAGGNVKWSLLMAEASGAVQVSPHVEWNFLVQSSNRMELLEHQGWLVGSLSVGSIDGLLARISCLGVPSFHLVKASGNGSHISYPHAGDIYHGGRIASFIRLSQGEHLLVVRVRAKVQTTFHCHASEVAVGKPHLLNQLPTQSPDVVEGLLWGEWASLPVTNPGTSWLSNVRCTAIIEGDEAKEAQSASYPVAPGGMIMLPCRLPATVRRIKCARQAGSDDDFVSVTLRVRAIDPVTAEEVPIIDVAHQLRCRKLHQSALFTFRDHDGSVQSAAAVAPLPLGALPPPVIRGGPAKKATKVSYADPRANATYEDGTVPVLLTLHGTGVTAQRQADSFKVKPAGAKDYVFGVEGYWLLAPSRHGAHNHQGTGHWHALSAIDALHALVSRIRSAAGAIAGSKPASCPNWRASTACLPAPNTRRVLFSGHSMGGAGAWHAVTAASDRAIAAAPLAGWLVKESYGDANSFMAFDASEPYVEPALKTVLLASVQDQRSDSHAANLAGIPTHVRVGERDSNTPPYLSRRMVRLLTEAGAGGPPATGVNATAAASFRGKWPRYEEVSGTGDVGTHWWWSTHTDDDGGVVDDDVLRAFYEAHRGRASTSVAMTQLLSGGEESRKLLSALPTAFTIVSTNPHVYAAGRAGISILQLATYGRRAVVNVRMVTVPDLGRVWQIDATNVRRLRFTGLHLRRLAAHDPNPCLESTDAEPSPYAPTHVCIDSQLFSALKAADIAAVSDLCAESDGELTWRTCKESTSGSAASIATDGGQSAPTLPSSEETFWNFERTERGPHNSGPMRAVVSSPFYIVVGTSGPPEATHAYNSGAQFLSQLHASAFDSLAPVVNDTQLWAGDDCDEATTGLGPHIVCLVPGHNLILLGSPAHNVWTRRVYGENGHQGRARSFPIEFDAVNATNAHGLWAAFRLPFNRRPSRSFDRPGLGLASTVGWWDTSRNTNGAPRARLALLLAATDAAGWASLMRLAEPTIPPMVRSPFSNLFPDFVVADAQRLSRRGADGLIAAGFYDATWGVADGGYLA